MIQDKTIAFLIAPEGVEQVELTEPWRAVREAGGTPRLISTRSGNAQAFRHLDRGDTFPINATVDTVYPEDFDGLVLPGGVANPDFLRTHEGAVRFVRGFFDAGLPVATATSETVPLTSVRGVMLTHVVSSPVDAHRGRRRARPYADVLAEPAHRPAQRRGHLGRRGGRDLPERAERARDEPAAG